MKVVLNIIRFIIFIPLCVFFIWAVYWLVSALLFWLTTLNFFWTIISVFILFPLGLFIGSIISLFASTTLMYITGFKKLSAIVAAIITIVYGFINLIVIWKMADTKYTMHLLSAIGGTAMVFYISYGFIAGCISKVEEENEKKKLATFIKIIDKECHN